MGILRTERRRIVVVVVEEPSTSNADSGDSTDVPTLRATEASSSSSLPPHTSSRLRRCEMARASDRDAVVDGVPCTSAASAVAEGAAVSDNASLVVFAVAVQFVAGDRVGHVAVVNLL